MNPFFARLECSIKLAILCFDHVFFVVKIAERHNITPMNKETQDMVLNHVNVIDQVKNRFLLCFYVALWAFTVKICDR